MAKKKKSAKKKSQVNKSQAVREHLAVDPDAMPMTVSQALKAKGIEVEPRVVSQIKYQLKTAGASQPASKGNGEQTTPRRTAPAARKLESLSADDLVKVKELSDQLGGQNRVEEALETLTKLQ